MPPAQESFPAGDLLTPPDREARFEDLVRRYGRLISAVVARVGGRPASLVKEDIEQRVLVSLWRQVEREQIIDHPSSYIYRAAVRETVRVLRQQLQASCDPLGDGDGSHGPRGPNDPHEALASRERSAQIEASLGSLIPERARAVRAHLAGFEVGEIMTMYGWPYQKARNLVARGMSDLRATLRAQGVHG